MNRTKNHELFYGVFHELVPVFDGCETFIWKKINFLFSLWRFCYSKLVLGGNQFLPMVLSYSKKLLETKLHDWAGLSHGMQ